MKKSTVKKLLSLNVVLAILIGLLAMPVRATTVATADSGPYGGEGDGTNLTWALTEDGVLTISGEGKVADWSWNTSPWRNCRDSIKTAVIGNSVTSNGSYACIDCTALTLIYFEGSAPAFGYHVFYYNVTATAYYPAWSDTWTEDITPCRITVATLPGFPLTLSLFSAIQAPPPKPLLPSCMTRMRPRLS